MITSLSALKIELLRTDEELVAEAQNGSRLAMEAVLLRHRSAVAARANSYFILGADRDDVMQEGMLGLFLAVRDFRPGMGSFGAFAMLCAGRRIITAIKTATRQKHFPLNLSTSLDEMVSDSGCAMIDTLPVECVHSPEELLLAKMREEDINSTIQSLLNDFELSALHDYLRGYSRQESAERHRRGRKSVDNALWRAKGKLRSCDLWNSRTLDDESEPQKTGTHK